MLLSSLSQSHHYKRKSITNRETPQINLANLISSTLILFVDFDYLLTIISLQQALCYFQLIPTPLKHPSPAHPPCKTPCYLYQSPRLHDDSILQTIQNKSIHFFLGYNRGLANLFHQSNCLVCYFTVCPRCWNNFYQWYIVWRVNLIIAKPKTTFIANHAKINCAYAISYLHKNVIKLNPLNFKSDCI